MKRHEVEEKVMNKRIAMLGKPDFKQSMSGAALIVSLVILLVMTMLGIAAVSTTRLEERMSGNARDMSIAFQAAETALRDGERLLNKTIKPAFDGSTPGLYPESETGGQLYAQGDWDWTDDAIEYGGLEIPGVAEQPRYYIEFIGEEVQTGGSLVIGFETKEKVSFYRITAYGLGRSTTANVILQTSFATY